MGDSRFGPGPFQEFPIWPQSILVISNLAPVHFGNSQFGPVPFWKFSWECTKVTHLCGNLCGNFGWNFFRSLRTLGHKSFWKKRHPIWSNFASAAPFTICNPIYGLTTLYYISQPRSQMKYSAAMYYLFLIVKTTETKPRPTQQLSDWVKPKRNMTHLFHIFLMLTFDSCLHKSI